MSIARATDCGYETAATCEILDANAAQRSDKRLAEALESPTRLDREDEEFTPFASRLPFELWFLPRCGQAWYEHADLRTDSSLAEAPRVVCYNLHRALDHPPDNLTKVAGFEWGTGF